MIHFIDKTLENLVPYVPLFQALIWPLFIALLIFLFRHQFDELWIHLLARIKSGSPIKAGPIELGGMVPATAEEMEQKLDEEVSEIQPIKPSPPQTRGESRLNERDIRKTYQLAEQLVLDRLEKELGKKLHRNARSVLGPGFIFDGFYQNELRGIAIEVKYAGVRGPSTSSFRSILDRANSFRTYITEKNADFSLLFAVVTDNAFQGSKDSMLLQFKEISSKYSFPTDIRFYELEELEKNT